MDSRRREVSSLLLFEIMGKLQVQGEEMTKVGTKEFMDWYVGKGKEFKNLKELLKYLRRLRKTLGPFVGYAGGPVDEEIVIVEKMIKEGKG